VAIPPLAGFNVAVTADRRAEEQVTLLQRRGASVLVGPAVRTLPLADDGALSSAIERVIESPPEVTVLLTGIGTRGLLGAAEAMGRDVELIDVLSESLVVARGPKASGAAATAGLDVGWQTPGERSIEIVERLAPEAARGARIAIQRDGHYLPILAEALRELGADVIDIPVYRWELPEDVRPAKRVIESVLAGEVDAVTFTSSPAVEHLIDLAREDDREEALLDAFAGDVAAACVGPVCADTARASGIDGVVVPRRARLGAMVQALVVHFADRSESFDVDGARITAQGSAVFVDDRPTTVSGREHALLLVLARAGGAVVPKPKLLREVWGAGFEDEHAVEVAVARLRQRLGPAAGAVQTVPRRGYRLAS
jgi:uroporphyrinogen-III synthase